MISSRALTGALLAALAAVGLWNAARYPPGLGYDAVDHIAYAELIVEQRELPDEVGEYYTPPLFYAIAGVATEAGEALGLGEPLRLTQGLNALAAVATALLLLALARTLWPGRPVVAVAALGFFVCGALVLKTAAMFHPELFDLLFSTLALALAAHMLVRERFDVRVAVLLGIALGAAQLVRAFGLWTFGAVVLAFLGAALVRERRSAVLRALAIVIAATAVVAGPWYAYQASRYTNPIFDRPQPDAPLWERRPAAFYVDPGLPEVITRPYRPSFVNRFAPTIYAEGWGDYFGVFAWRAADEPRPPDRRRLVAQSIVGLLPTALAVGGWLWLAVVSIRRVRTRPELLLVTSLPLAGVLGMLYFTVSYPTPDGDVIKGTYMLTTVPAWALCFAVALDRAWSRTRLRAPLAVLLTACAAVSLVFSAYELPLQLIP